jgi:hypothetical protein
MQVISQVKVKVKKKIAKCASSAALDRDGRTSEGSVRA